MSGASWFVWCLILSLLILALLALWMAGGYG